MFYSETWRAGSKGQDPTGRAVFCVLLRISPAPRPTALHPLAPSEKLLTQRGLCVIKRQWAVPLPPRLHSFLSRELSVGGCSGDGAFHHHHHRRLCTWVLEPQSHRVPEGTELCAHRALLDLRVIPGKWRDRPCLLPGSPVCHLGAQERSWDDPRI